MIESIFCVISKSTFGDYDVHDIQTNTSWTSNPYGDGYAIVPNEMIEDIQGTCGYCDIELNEEGTKVISFVAREIPEIEEPEVVNEPSADEVLNTLLGV